MRILIVEDEPKIASFVRRGLEAEGFAVTVAARGDEGLQLARDSAFDLVILDLMLPGLTGEQVLDELRGSGDGVPVIALSAKDAISDRVSTLDAGADDYVTKPFSFSELLARIRARLRPTPQSASTTLAAGPMQLDLRTREVTVDGSSAELTSREFTLLEVFLRHPNQVLSQAQLLDRVWGFQHDPSSNIVEVYVGYLRRKLGDRRIETVRGVGYRLQVR
ncbi:MAG: response regulator transcription factor [Solirubrobacteraceae bacterium]|nr:response regulator transcription factor [Solirubrobacteraceae bacterium]